MAVERAEAVVGLRGDTAFPADHSRALVSSARAALCLARGDLAGADKALRAAYVAALATGELPVLSPVAVHAAALAEMRGRRHESAVLLGTAARLRGAHDHVICGLLGLAHLVECVDALPSTLEMIGLPVDDTAGSQPDFYLGTRPDGTYWASAVLAYGLIAIALTDLQRSTGRAPQTRFVYLCLDRFTR
ncbi:hypothetical protein [Herbidospora mongoliensis]|uniref:hypothetical protein n=1 Tax=Herbidospora mongoliensis TaxID=688067 RepID=UPI000A7A0658|nr:hypothetical protein [Herbidospora mongoliensis]